MNIYQKLTNDFNTGGVRAVLAGGQAVVLHRLAIMSKDGDWILKEEPKTLTHVLTVLDGYGAQYRFGAPLDVRWLSAGWSSHLEFQWQGLRVRTDFVTRPPRIRRETLARLWQEAETQALPFANARDLAEMKKTNREKDYVVIGELARRMTDPESRLLYSRSARDLMKLAEQYSDHFNSLVSKRPLLATIPEGRAALETALDKERRELIHTNEERLKHYLEAAQPWASLWPELSRCLKGLSLPEAHARIVQAAENILPTAVPGGLP